MKSPTQAKSAWMGNPSKLFKPEKSKTTLSAGTACGMSTEPTTFLVMIFRLIGFAKPAFGSTGYNYRGTCLKVCAGT